VKEFGTPDQSWVRAPRGSAASSSGKAEKE
jgi:hypothetical protein